MLTSLNKKDIGFLLAASFSFIADARATVSSDMIMPVTPWSISAITTSPPPYCVAMRRYSDGSILSLSQNARGDLMLALDWHKHGGGVSLTTAYLATQNEGAAMNVLPPPAQGARLRVTEPLLHDLVKYQRFSFSLDGQPRSWTGAPSLLEIRLLRLCATLLDPGRVEAPLKPLAEVAPDDTVQVTAPSQRGGGQPSQSPAWEVYD